MVTHAPLEVDMKITLKEIIPDVRFGAS
jgi:hypothetical protein